MTKDQITKAIDDAESAHVAHLFDAFRLSILSVRDAKKVGQERDNFSRGLDEIEQAHSIALSVVQGRSGT